MQIKVLKMGLETIGHYVIFSLSWSRRIRREIHTGWSLLARDSFYKQQDGHTRYQFIVRQGKVRFFWDYWRWLLRRTPVKWSHFPLLHSVLLFLGVDVYFEHIFIWLFCRWNNFFLEYLEWRLQRLPLLCWRKESATWFVEKFQMQ